MRALVIVDSAFDQLQRLEIYSRCSALRQHERSVWLLVRFEISIKRISDKKPTGVNQIATFFQYTERTAVYKLERPDMPGQVMIICNSEI